MSDTPSTQPRSLQAMQQLVETWRASDNPPIIVTTNGCFDILHIGHLRYLQAARAFGDRLIIALNADASVRRLKGSSRPIVSENDRAELLLGLSCVDEVVLFEDDGRRTT